MESVGFIGLGAMGAPMAGRIVAAGFDLSVFDVRPENAEPLVEAGRKVAAHEAEHRDRVGHDDGHRDSDRPQRQRRPQAQSAPACHGSASLTLNPIPRIV